MKFYISFSQSHAHSIDGLTYDKDSLMLVEAPDEISARIGVNGIVHGVWRTIYPEEMMPGLLSYFPHGVINADKPIVFPQWKKSYRQLAEEAEQRVAEIETTVKYVEAQLDDARRQLDAARITAEAARAVVTEDE